MTEKKITRKVISKAPSVKETEKTQQVQSKKACFFCQSKRGTATDNPSYTDITLLRRFTTDRVKIVPRSKSNLCSKHQREVTRQIKYARHLALLPFIPKI